ncbi:jg26803 [Pararge aegeria aegeria]|uniref:Jg26803 protein n=1 Tax=Pararge aegeria aegeria TaxID=348720 RepID=A0A8S4SG51_9NEOP|nr:jg26803 [Pararge aegeria aegeria]
MTHEAIIETLPSIKEPKYRSCLRKAFALHRPLTSRIHIYRTKVHSCCNRSNSTVVESNASTRSRVAKPKSQSLTSIVKERDIHIMPFDIPDYYANISQQQQTAPDYVQHKKERSYPATSTRTENNEAAFLTPVNDSVQTLDHSINLNKNSEYPLFVKIVRV